MSWAEYIYMFGYDCPLKMLSLLWEDMHNTVVRSQTLPAFGYTEHTGRMGKTMVSHSGVQLLTLFRSSCSNSEKTQGFAEPYRFLIQNSLTQHSTHPKAETKSTFPKPNLTDSEYQRSSK